MIIIQAKGSEPALEQRLLEILRREHIDAEQFSFSSRHSLTFPALTIDGGARRAFQNGKELPLTRIEFDLLLVLASNPGRVCSREALFRAVWGPDSQDTQKVVANTISNLRGKLRQGGGQPRIRTTQGGYMFLPE